MCRLSHRRAIIKEGLSSFSDANEMDVEWKVNSLNTLKEAMPYLQEDMDLQNANERTFLKLFAVSAIDALVQEWKHRESSELENRHLIDFKYTQCLMELVGALLSDSPWSVQMVEALKVCLAEYGYRALGVPRKLGLEFRLQQALVGEPALYALKPEYRDHFFHAVEVCLMGYSLLTSKVTSEKSLARHIIDSSESGDFVPTDEAVFLKQWWIAALIHDTGYAMEIVKGSLSFLSYFDDHHDIDKFARITRENIEKLSADFDEFVELKDDPELGSDHGVIAAVHLRRTLQGIGIDNVEEYEGAIRAIAFHNSRYPSVDGSKDPIAAFLIICDSFREWRRANLGSEYGSAIILSRLLDAADQLDLTVFESVERFDFNFKNEQEKNESGEPKSTFSWQNENTLNVEVEYGAGINLNDRVLPLWMDSTYNLQRVRLSKLPFNIKIHYKTPLPSGQTQLNRLKNCMDEMGMDFIQPWLETALSDGTNKAIHYNQDDTWEIISLDLRLLEERFASSPILGGNMSDFEQSIKIWSGYSSDKKKL